MVQFATLPSKPKDSDTEDAVKMTSSNPSDQELPNGSGLQKGNAEDGHSKKRKRKQKSEKGGKVNGSSAKRRHSVSKPARDPRDEASPVRPQEEIAGTRSPSPVIDFDGLSRPSMSSFTPRRIKFDQHQVLELAHAKKKRPSRPKLDSRNWLVQSEQSSNVSAKIQIARDF